jgi:hypothetical protein
VQPVGNFDDDHPHVVIQGKQHLPEVLCLQRNILVVLKM